ncbi:MAG: heavy metal-binding domain-containing protein [Oxalobacter sp.]|nr:heavy metal-binding domain-containing protein [Oxalobacter sp.]
MILDKLKDKVDSISAEIKKNFHPCDICGRSITTDIDRCPSCEDAYLDLTDPARMPQDQEQINSLINRFVMILPKMADGELKDTITSNLDRLRAKSNEIGQHEQAVAAAASSPKKPRKPVLLSNTETVVGHTVSAQLGIVTVSRTVTLTTTDGQRETDDAVKTALDDLATRADALGANAIINIRIGYTGVESMTLAPKVLLTVTGTAATVPSNQPENTVAVAESPDNGIEL